MRLRNNADIVAVTILTLWFLAAEFTWHPRTEEFRVWTKSNPEWNGADLLRRIVERLPDLIR